MTVRIKLTKADFQNVYNHIERTALLFVVSINKLRARPKKVCVFALKI